MNFAGHTALHVAFNHRQNDMADFLIRSGAKPCRNKCQKCALNIKIRSRAGAKKKVTSKPPKKAVETHKEASDRVFEEEFGNMDFMKELALMKAETGLEGSFKFAPGAARDLGASESGGGLGGPSGPSGVDANSGSSNSSSTSPPKSKKKKKKKKKKPT